MLSCAKEEMQKIFYSKQDGTDAFVVSSVVLIDIQWFAIVVI